MAEQEKPKNPKVGIIDGIVNASVFLSWGAVTMMGNLSSLRKYQKEKEAAEEKIPAHELEKVDVSIPQLVGDLHKQKITSLYLGEGSHLSVPVQNAIGEVMAAAYKDNPDTVPFRENPEKGKANKDTFALITERSKTYHASEADEAREKALSQNGKTPLNTDSWLGPDHRYEQEELKLFNSPYKLGIPAALTGEVEEALRGTERDIGYRNTNMANAITATMTNKPAGTPFLFSVGDRHLDRNDAASVPNQLDSKLADHPAAIIDVIPVKLKEAAGLYRETNQRDGKPVYDVMVYDPINGFDVKDGIVQMEGDASARYHLKPSSTPTVAPVVAAAKGPSK